VQELQGNVRVFVRARMDDRKEPQNYLLFPSRTEIMYMDGKSAMTYEYERVFSPIR
jgi:hypothetical protein